MAACHGVSTTAWDGTLCVHCIEKSQRKRVLGKRQGKDPPEMFQVENSVVHVATAAKSG